MLQLAVTDRSRSHHQRTIRNSLPQSGVFSRSSQQLARADGGTSFPERELEGVHQTQVGAAEVAHGAGSRTDIERIARGDQHDVQIVQVGRQAPLFYAGNRPGLEQFQSSVTAVFGVSWQDFAHFAISRASYPFKRGPLNRKVLEDRAKGAKGQILPETSLTDYLPAAFAAAGTTILAESGCDQVSFPLFRTRRFMVTVTWLRSTSTIK